MQEYAEKFYKSKRWQKTKSAYSSFRRGLCERCLAKGIYTSGEIVHHKVHITPENITDPSVTLNFDNLELVCRQCHGELHRHKRGEKGARYTLDEDGRVIF